MPSPWDRYSTFVQLRLVPIGAPSDFSKFNLVNDARNGASLGILTMDGDERTYIVNHLIPSEDNRQYQFYIFDRLTNPTRYSVNGRKLNTYSITEQLAYLNEYWAAQKPLLIDPPYIPAPTPTHLPSPTPSPTPTSTPTPTPSPTPSPTPTPTPTPSPTPVPVLPPSSLEFQSHATSTQDMRLLFTVDSGTSLTIAATLDSGGDSNTSFAATVNGSEQSNVAGPDSNFPVSLTVSPGDAVELKFHSSLTLGVKGDIQVSGGRFTNVQTYGYAINPGPTGYDRAQLDLGGISGSLDLSEISLRDPDTVGTPVVNPLSSNFVVQVNNVSGWVDSDQLVSPLTTRSSTADTLRMQLIPSSTSNGQLWAVGKNAAGQLGDNTVTNRSTPIHVNTSQVSMVTGNGAGGGPFVTNGHCLFLKNDGTLWAMGYNLNGQLGDGTTTNSHVAEQIATGVSKISSGVAHNLFLKTDGTLWAMGLNSSGQLGDATNTERHSPVQVATDVSDIAAGANHSLFIKNDGTLWGAGLNSIGQLGDGTTTNRSTFMQMDTDVIAVTAGGTFSLYLKSNGDMWGVGDNSSGQLGLGAATGHYYTPQLIIGGVSKINAGLSQSFYIMPDGTLWGMGLNTLGSLGDGTTTTRKTAVQIMTGVAFASSGSAHSLLLKTDGTLWSTGLNSSGQLGDTTTTNRSTPAQIDSGVVSIGASSDSSYYIKPSSQTMDFQFNVLN